MSNRYSYEDVLYKGLFTFGRVCSTRSRGKVDRYKRLKLTFYNFLRFRKESRHMLKLLGDKCICFCAGENPEFPLTIQRGVN